MRIVYPSSVRPTQPDNHPLVFESQQGTRFRISVLEPDLVRVEHLPDGTPRMERTWTVVGFDRSSTMQIADVPREGRQRSDYSGFSLPTYTTRVSDEVVEIDTGQVHIEASTGEFGLRWYNQDGVLFAADRDIHAYPYDRQVSTVYHYMRRYPDEYFYGFGERAGSLDKSGRRMRMFNLDALGYNARTSDPLYKHIPFFITFNSKTGTAYGLLYDNLSTTVFDIGCELDNYYPPYRYYQAAGGDLDYYLIYGPSIPEVVQKYAALTGRTALPPRWSLGYLGSTMTYTEASNAQEQLRQFVDLCEKHNIPCDMFHLSSGYGSDEQGKRYVFNWNLQKIPDPDGMVDYFHQGGIKLAANIKPALLTSHPRYQEVADLGAFIQSADKDKPELSIFWGGLGAHIDFTNPQGYEWWVQRVLDRLLNYDIDATWNDNNEYSLSDDQARCHGFGETIPVGYVRPLHSLLMTRASRSAQLIGRPDERPFLLTRSGCPGIQRYAQTWSGDNLTSWETLRYNIPMGLGLSLSGVPNLGHDVGGFAGSKPDPELFVRWVQNGIFHPRFTIHSWNDDGSVNEPWMYPEVLPIIRETIEFRYRLIPYLYSLFFHSTRTGEPIIRPLVYNFPDDPQCRTESFDFLLGADLLVASVLEDGARTRQVYLPSGTSWCDFHTGVCYDGGQTIEVDAPLERIPLFVRGGGVIPMGKMMRHFGAQPDDLRQILLFPSLHGEGNSFRLIEDDGISHGYQQGEYTEIEWRLSSNQEQIQVHANILHKGYPLPYTEFEVIVPPGEERPMVGVDIDESWRDDDGRWHHRVRVESLY